MAVSVNLDPIAAVSANQQKVVKLNSDGSAESFIVDRSQLGVVEAGKGITTALIRGIASRCNELGYNIGRINAYMTMDVLTGSGLRSLASIESLK